MRYRSAFLAPAFSAENEELKPTTSHPSLESASSRSRSDTPAPTPASSTTIRGVPGCLRGGSPKSQSGERHLCGSRPSVLSASTLRTAATTESTVCIVSPRGRGSIDAITSPHRTASTGRIRDVAGFLLNALRLAGRFGRVWSGPPASRLRLASEAVAWLPGRRIGGRLDLADVAWRRTYAFDARSMRCESATGDPRCTTCGAGRQSSRTRIR